MPYSQPTNTEPYDIIMLNMSTMHDWNSGVVNRNYHMLQTLKKDDRVRRVVAVDFFPIGLRRGLKQFWHGVVKARNTSDVVYGDVSSICYQKDPKEYVYATIDSLYSWKRCIQELRKVEKRLGLQNIIVWSYNPTFVSFIGKLREKMFVFDTVDNWLEHTHYINLIGSETLNKNYQKIADRADLIFTVADELKYFYEKMGRTQDVYWVPNGVDYDHFNNADLTCDDAQLQTITDPIIGYMGTIQDRVDLDLVRFIAQNNPDKKIVLCGPVWKSCRAEVDTKLRSLPNIIFTGRIPYKKSPCYINRFDVAIIPHVVNKFLESTNPMKLYEYLSCGKPVVTTAGSGVSMFQGHISITNDYEKFNQAINRELKSDSIKKQEARRATVKPHAWTARVDTMLDVVHKHAATM